jgi:N-acetylmuramoyl-L-alanine amidase
MRRWVLALAFVAGGALAKEVAVDVGHYLAEPGAISARGRSEFEYNLELAQRVAAALKARGFRVRMIGERGDFASLGARVRAARGADLMLSIHHDSIKQRLVEYWEHDGSGQHYNDQVAGFSLFVSRFNVRPGLSLACASRIGAALRAGGFRPSRYHADPLLGEARPFADEANGVHYFDRLAVGRARAVPSLLIEAGVIVNRDEELRLRDPAVHEAIAQAVAQGVARCLR